MLSRLLIGLPHEGHLDRGVMTDSFRGARYTTTFRNDPITTPSKAQPPISRPNTLYVFSGRRSSDSLSSQPYRTHDLGATSGATAKWEVRR